MSTAAATKTDDKAYRSYVCAFRGRRDGYQVPLAMAQAGRLDEFITDIYFGPVWRLLSQWLSPRQKEKLAQRRIDGIPPGRVRCLWFTTLREHIRHRLGLPSAETYSLLDRDFSLAAAARAGKTCSNIFLYSSYAWDAFSRSYPHNPRKILFQYHPHIEVEAEILAVDAARHPTIFETHGSTLELLTAEEGEARLLGDSAWKMADAIVCASSFTRQTLVQAGADPSSIVVIPYGVEMPDESPVAEAGPFHALYVGSGLQRKGLHHLLLAWKAANLPEDSRLTIVSRVIDERLRAILDVPGVTLIEGLSLTGLQALYRSVTVFVMPSLIEGFGQVYLEALSYGLPVLGTRNTCLPDLGDENDSIFVSQAGDVADLTAMLTRLSVILPGNNDYKQRARDCASRFTWSRFRDGIREVL